MRRRPRRILAGALVVAGALIMLLTPDLPFGLGLLVAAVVVEFVGIRLDHRR